MTNLGRTRKRIFVGMSGGVDSSVSAALLKKAGFEVVGVFIKIWEPSFNFSTVLGTTCSWREERREARRAAAHLDIPLLTLDLSREYKKRVVDYFIAEYKSGRTPNPDVMCNKHIKFGVFYDWAMKNSADFVATGHYSQILRNEKRKVPEISNPPLCPRVGEGSFSFGVSQDLKKDQTYFLWNLKTEQLSKILFPVGKYTKPKVRALAKKFGLPNADKKDSQGLCFVGKIDFKDFLKHELAEKSGAVLNEQGEIIGEHDGAMFFTLGERHGFKIFSQTSNSKPYYIVAKDIEKNTLTVATNSNHSDQGRALISEVKIEKTNWLNPKIKKLGFLARVRYRQPLQKCRVLKIDTKKSGATIAFDQPQLAVSGQSLVLYDKNICLGGGIIA